jgi:hypothetical protein
MKDDHIVNPIQAYGEDGLIAPQKYCAELQGATIVLIFMLSCYTKADQATFWASIVHIDIIKSPSSLADDRFSLTKCPAPPETNPLHLKKKGVTSSSGRKKSKIWLTLECFPSLYICILSRFFLCMYL